MAAVTICSDFGAPKNKVFHSFHWFPIYNIYQIDDKKYLLNTIGKFIENTVIFYMWKRNQKRIDKCLCIKITESSFCTSETNTTFSSVQFSHSVVSDSLLPHELQHARPRCPTPTPGVHSDSHPLSQWCHSAISSSVVPFSSCPQSLPASESFPMSQIFAWGG